MTEGEVPSPVLVTRTHLCCPVMLREKVRVSTQACASLTTYTASHRLWKGVISFLPCPLCWDYAGSAWARFVLSGSQQSFHLRMQEPRFCVKDVNKAL